MVAVQKKKEKNHRLTAWTAKQFLIKLLSTSQYCFSHGSCHMISDTVRHSRNSGWGLAPLVTPGLLCRHFEAQMEYVEIQSELKDSQKPEEKWKRLNNNLEPLQGRVKCVDWQWEYCTISEYCTGNMKITKQHLASSMSRESRCTFMSTRIKSRARTVKACTFVVVSAR